MPGSFHLSTLTSGHEESVARLLHRSLVQWYESRLGQGNRFGSSHEPFLQFPRVYEELDPGEAQAAWDDETHDLLGVCFTHERETHLAIGIVATAPEAGGRGIARKMMEAALEKARTLGKPARLVSSLLNLDSFSLYTRMGFVPGLIFQDLMLAVPETGMTVPPPPGTDRVREARSEEAAQIADREQELQHIRREKDYRYFLADSTGAWKVLVAEDAEGKLQGCLVVGSSFGMLGPGFARDADTAAALLWRGLDDMRGRSPVFLLPCREAALVRTLYGWGARNIELHVAQSTAPGPEPVGITFPTFLPESA